MDNKQIIKDPRIFIVETNSPCASCDEASECTPEHANFCCDVCMYLHLRECQDCEKYQEEFENEDECPCNTCGMEESCDGWEAKFCCTYCQWLGGGDCDSCDPMDI